jgi:hypothetical protein
MKMKKLTKTIKMKGYFKKIGHGVLLLGLLFFLFSSGKSDQNNEWKKLFNGQNLDGWEYRGGGDAPPTFNVENGTIVGRTLIPFNDGAFMCTKEQFKDFELEFEVKIDEGLNSGVQLRSTPEGTVKGAQIEIESGFHRTGFIFGQGMGMWLSEEFDEKNDAFIKDEWNKFRVVVQGQNIKTWINDKPIEDLTHERVAPEGVIALQVHGYPRGKKREAGAKEILSVAWKNIKIKEL